MAIEIEDGQAEKTMSDAVLAIAMADFRLACANEPDAVERVRKAMTAAADPRNYSLDYRPDDLFRGALGAAISESPEADKDRIKRSIDAHRALTALLSGVPVDFETAMDRAGTDVIPLGRMWADILKPANQKPSGGGAKQ